MYYFVLIVFLIVLIVAFVQYGFPIPVKNGLPILMYHKISDKSTDKYTINTSKFERHLNFILSRNYTPITFTQLLQYQVHNIKLPEKPVIISFDDAYENNYLYLYPLLKKYRLKATIFIPVGAIGKTNDWDEGNEAIMTFEQLKKIDPNYVEFGLHAFSHKNLKNLSNEELQQDMQNCISTLSSHSIVFCPVLAYPYGGYPKSEKAYESFTKTLKNSGILMGLRIGNRVNGLPIKDLFCIKRIDMHGTDSFREFKTKLRKGRVKLF